MRAWGLTLALILAWGLGAGGVAALAQSPPAMPAPIWGENDPIITFEDALLAFRPLDDQRLRLQPRDSLPATTYFRWRGRITAMESSQGPFTEHTDPFRGGKRLQGWRFMIFLCLDPPGPFAFRDIRRAYVELEAGTEVEVIGRYAGSIQVERPYREILTLPLLDNCYVR